MEITITRDENGFYVIKDYQGRSITESRETLLKMLGFALDRQDKLIADFKKPPQGFAINPMMQDSKTEGALPPKESTYMGQPVSEMSQEKLIKALETMSKAYHQALTGKTFLQG